MAQEKMSHTKASEKSKSPSRSWKALTPSLAEWILEAVRCMGFERMTPVQASAIPLFTGNKDPVVEAVTGSGKTLAFLIPVVERLLRLEEPLPKHHVGAIIIAPTRELAIQIHTVLTQLLAFHSPSSAWLHEFSATDGQSSDTSAKSLYSSNDQKIVPQLLLGGTNSSPRSDLSAFLKTSPNLLIATPGRLLELLSSPHVHAPQSSFQMLVLDEADRLLDLGFKDTLSRILQRLPKQRRTGLFSASVSEAVEELVRVGLQNPYRVNVKVKSLAGAEDARTPASLRMHYLPTRPTHKLPFLLKLVSNLDPPPLRTIVYAPTCATVDYFQHVLPAVLPIVCSDSRLTIVSMHGKHKQEHREKNLARFSNASSSSILLTTDVAARGLDIPAVDLTVQLDPPTDEKSFLHRAGRAGRAGRRGIAVVFLIPGREADEYPAYLSVRKTPVSMFNKDTVHVSDDEAQEASRRIRDTVRQDRALHEKAQKAFPGYVQAYRKHKAASIFRVSDLPWQDLADAWGLLKMPKMPEVKRWGGNVQIDVDMDWKNYAYKDKEREKSRKTKLKQTGEQAHGAELTQLGNKRKREQDAWSKKRDEREVKEARKEKRKRKRVKEREDKMTNMQKNEHEELQSLIEQVRKQNGVSAVSASADEEFRGFD